MILCLLVEVVSVTDHGSHKVLHMEPRDASGPVAPWGKFDLAIVHKGLASHIEVGKRFRVELRELEKDD